MEENVIYLIVFGQNVQRGLSCYKESIINDGDLEKYKEILDILSTSQDKELNWAWGIYVAKDSNDKYIEHHRIYEFYKNIDPNLLDSFSSLLPGGITKIESIKIFKGTKIKVI